MQLLEKKIEKKVCDYAKSKGFLVFKFKGVRGVPDRIFMKSGTVFFIEFKTQNGRLSPLQHKVIRDLKTQDIDAHVIYDAQSGFRLINNYYKKIGK